jgi:hypothetical protein
MPFLFKLAKRIARIRSRSWILAAAAAFACDSSDSFLSGPTDTSFAITDGAVTDTSATVLLRESFEDASFAARGWYDTTSMATTTVQHIPGSTSALQVFYKAGAKNPMSARQRFPASESVYLSYWVKYSSNWVGSGGAYSDEFFLLTNEDGPLAGPSRTHLTTSIKHIYQNGGIPVFQLRDGLNIDQSRLGQNLTTVTENRAVAGCNGNTDGYGTQCNTFNNEKTFQARQPSFLPTPGPAYMVDWHRVEAFVKLNSIQNGKGVPDGALRYWFDGRLVIDQNNVLLRTGAHPNMKFNQLVIAPYMANGSPIDQIMWVDNLTIVAGQLPSAPAAHVASVVVSPPSANLGVGGTVQLTAMLRDSSGNVMTGRSPTWASSNATVATVSGSGLITAFAAGSSTISATSEGKSTSATITVTAAPQQTPRPGFYVTPTGTRSGDGSMSRPWDLATALSGAAGRVRPGDTIWLRGGTYHGSFTSTLIGTAANPIIVRQYPGERATINSGSVGQGLRVQGAYTYYWGFEVMSSNPTANSTSGYGINNYNAIGAKFINLVIHDSPGQGFANWYANGARGVEIYGCILYNNGQNRNKDHGLYVNNDGAESVSVSENIVFNNFAHGVQIYAKAKNVTVRGNIVFNNNTISGDIGQSDFVIADDGAGITGLIVDQNYTYRSIPNSTEGSMLVGLFGAPSNRNIQITNNVIAGGRTGLWVAGSWASSMVTGNTIYAAAGVKALHLNSRVGQTWSGNRFYGNSAFSYAAGSAVPYATWQIQNGLLNAGSHLGNLPPDLVVTRPNRYEPGRANIVVYNWSGAARVSVDLSGVLRAGQSYKIFNTQNIFGSPVVSGIYTGGSVSIPMAGMPAPVPIGRGRPGPLTGPTFDAFVLMTTP